MERRLEYIEDQLEGTSTGRVALSIIERHAPEVMYLVNNNRQVMVVWNRNKGPAFIKSFMESGYEDIEFVRAIDGISLEYLLLQMGECLMDNGSMELKGTIGKYAALVLKILTKARSLKEILQMIREHSPEGADVSGEAGK